MRIQGLQKLTLLDYPEHVACTVFTLGCNFRCPFCHNASLVLRPGENPAYFEEEIYAFLKKRQGILDGVAITGGEPLLPHNQQWMKEFSHKMLLAGYDVDFDEAMRRQGMYRTEEQDADHKCKIGRGR